MDYRCAGGGDFGRYLWRLFMVEDIFCCEVANRDIGWRVLSSLSLCIRRIDLRYVSRDYSRAILHSREVINMNGATFTEIVVLG